MEHVSTAVQSVSAEQRGHTSRKWPLRPALSGRVSGRAAWRFRGIVPGGQRRTRLLGPRLAGQPPPGEVRTVAAAWHLGALRTRGEANSPAPSPALTSRHSDHIRGVRGRR